MRVPGHKLESLTHNGERAREESAWTGRCTCGWEESCRRKGDVRAEYAVHLRITKYGWEGRHHA